MSLFRSLHTWRRRAAALAATASLVGAAPPALAAGQVTIVEGPATLIEGARALQATEGQKLGDETLVRTAANSKLLRVEWPDGNVADFGPDTLAMLSPAGFGLRSGRAPAVYLLRGWLKLSSMGSGPTAGLLTPRLDVQPFKGALVVMAVGDETWAFAEAGTAPLLERDLKPASNLALKNGEVYGRSGSAKGSVSPRPTSAQMQRVPRGFRDSLPLRSAAFKDKAISAKAGPPPSYTDLSDWLVAERPLRKNFTRRFSDRLQDPSFRSALAERLTQHPEWEPVLFPERFVKPPPAPR